jgi:hypothetical protein
MHVGAQREAESYLRTASLAGGFRTSACESRLCAESGMQVRLAFSLLLHMVMVGPGHAGGCILLWFTSLQSGMGGYHGLHTLTLVSAPCNP